MLKKARHKLFTAILASSMLFAGGLSAAEFDWGDVENILDSSRYAQNQLVDNSRSRSLERDKFKDNQRQKQPRKTMRYSLDYAVNKVRRQYNGTVVGARTDWRGDEAVHKVKIRTDKGRIRTVYVSGTTGR